MELRSLANFVLACQYSNHTEAAKAAQIPASSLSSAISALETELGLELFVSTPKGMVPSEAGRWLFQQATAILQVVETAFTGKAISTPLKVSSPFHFMFGKLSRAATAAIRPFRLANPNFYAQVQFRSSLVSAFDTACPDDTDIILGYASQAGGDQEHFLFDDKWIAVAGGLQSDETLPPLSPEDLRNHSLWLPPLLPAEEARIRDYCRLHDLPAPEVTSEDVGIFTRLKQAKKPVLLLTPQSLLANGISRNDLTVLDLEMPVYSPVTAKNINTDTKIVTAAQDFIHLMQEELNRQTVTLYNPPVSLHDIQSILTLYHCKNMSAAADSLNQTEAALSARLRETEQLMGTALFARHYKDLHPLPTAVHKIPLLQNVVNLAEATTQEARQIAILDEPVIYLGLSPMAMLNPLSALAISNAIAEWQSLCPHILLKAGEAPAQFLEEHLRRGEYSIIVCESTMRPENSALLMDLGPLQYISAINCEAAPLALPAPADSIRNALEQLPELHHYQPVLETQSLKLCLMLAGNGYNTIMPAALADTINSATALQQQTLLHAPHFYLTAGTNGTRNLNEHEHILLACLRKQFQTLHCNKAAPPVSPAPAAVSKTISPL